MYSINVIEHVADVEAVIAEARACPPAGRGAGGGDPERQLGALAEPGREAGT
jgi:hypothetical protein